MMLIGELSKEVINLSFIVPLAWEEFRFDKIKYRVHGQQA